MRRFIPWLLFSLSICIVGFAYGVAASRFGWWPNRLILEAENAYKALQQTAAEELGSFNPVGFEFFDPDGTAEPIVTLKTEAAGKELILVSGGHLRYARLCPHHGCLAWLMDRSGNVLHTWEVDPKIPWGDLKQVQGLNLVDRLSPYQMHLYPNGDLLVSYQGRNTYPFGIGLAKFDKDSKLLWSRENFAHHWFTVDSEGRILTPRLRKLPLPYRFGSTNLVLECEQIELYEDTVATLDPDGNLIEEFSILDTLVDSGYAGAVFRSVFGTRGPTYRQLDNPMQSCDPTHLNNVQVLGTNDADDYPGLNAGDLLISMRTLNAIAVIDSQTKRIKRFSQGRSLMQHSPRFIGNNQVLVFDNHGGRADQGGSRLLALPLEPTQTPDVLFPTPETPGDIHFTSYDTGHIELSADRSRVLVALTRDGRVLEISRSAGTRLWEYQNTHDIAHFVGDIDGQNIARLAIFTAHYVYNANFRMNREPAKTADAL
ncbi:MAG: hypothetical protein KDI42_06380 [Gammaproteobacteria bacterium]|nr:hypothetical protein [Gammaproteobacteria bacterium]